MILLFECGMKHYIAVLWRMGLSTVPKNGSALYHADISKVVNVKATS
jgi:hypothetical protein